MKKNNTGDKIITIIGYLIAILWLIPLVWMVGTAFSEPSFKMSLFPKTAFTLDNIKYVWNAVPFKTYYINTILIVIVTFTIQVFTSTMAAYALAVMDFKGVAIVFVIIFMQIIVPNDVLITPNFMVLRELGMLNTKLGIMLPFLGSAFGIFLLRQHFKSIPKSLAEAARIDGASQFQIMTKIYLPLSVSALTTVSLFYAVSRWNGYFWTMVLLIDDKKAPLQVFLKKLIVEKNMAGEASQMITAQSLTSPQTIIYAVIALSLIPIFIVYPFIQKFFRKGVTLGAVKE